MKYHIDFLDHYRIAGWAVDDAAQGPLELTLLDGEVAIATFKADIFRPDLAKAGVSNEGAAFNYAFNRYLSERQLSRLRIKFSHNGKVVNIPSASLKIPERVDPEKVNGPVGELQTPLIPKFRSLFGGNWADLSNAHDSIEGKLDLGWIDENEADLLRHWVDFGYVIIRNAVDHSLIDQVHEQWQSALTGESDDIWVEAFHEGNKVFAPANKKFDDERVKLLDLYSVSQAARDISLNDQIVRFLSLVFERPPLAFQSLSFRNGTEQPVHQDTAYVKVSSPMELAASWVALEDIKPDTGELEYYPGSHNFSDFLWSGKDKWVLERIPGESQRFLSSLHEKADEKGLEIARFLPKKGDVLIWSADLAHGGSKVTNKHTRKSLVTHYCPKDCNPYYFYKTLHSDKIPHNKGYYAFEVRKQKQG